MDIYILQGNAASQSCAVVQPQLALNFALDASYSHHSILLITQQCGRQNLLLENACIGQQFYFVPCKVVFLICRVHIPRPLSGRLKSWTVLNPIHTYYFSPIHTSTQTDSSEPYTYYCFSPYIHQLYGFSLACPQCQYHASYALGPILMRVT